MAEVISLQVDAKVGDAINATKSLKQQLKEATNEAQRLADVYGATSQEAIQAAKQTAVLKEKLSDFKGTVDALNPEAKFKAIGQVAQGIAGGFAAAQGAMALFGVQSEEVEKQLLKVQGALALSEGLNTILSLGDAFGNLKVVAVGAFNAIKTAIGSSGIGLLVIAIGAAVTGMMAYKDSVDDAAEAQARLNKQRDDFNKKTLEQIEYEIRLQKAKGEKTGALEVKLELAKQKQLFDAREVYIKKIEELDVKLAANRAKQANAITSDEKGRLAKAERELIEQQRLLYIERNKKNDEILKQNQNVNVARAQKDTEEIVKVEYETRIERRKEADIEYADAVKLGTNELNRELLDLNIKAQEESLQAEIDRIEKGKQLREAERQAKLSIAQSTVEGLSAIGTIFINDSKKLEKFQKGVALAQIAVDTAKAISSLVAYSNANPLNSITGGAAGIAQYATGIVSILTNIAKAKQLLSSGGNTSAPSLGGSVRPASGSNVNASNGVAFVNSPSQQGTLLNSQGINQSGIDTNYIKAIVVETDITNSQNNVKKIKNNATI